MCYLRLFVLWILKLLRLPHLVLTPPCAVQTLARRARHYVVNDFVGSGYGTARSGISGIFQYAGMDWLFVDDLDYTIDYLTN